MSGMARGHVEREGGRVRERLLRIIKFALVPYGKDANSIVRRQETVKSDVTGLAVGNHELAQFTLHDAADQRVIGEGINRFADCVGRNHRDMRIVRGDEFECTLKIGERGLRIDYLRHGRGRAALGLTASRPSQACTSSAR